MSKRYRTVVGLVVSVLVFVVGFPTVWGGWSINTSENTAKKIQPGMTLAEAEQIIGGPPGSHVVRFTEQPPTFHSAKAVLPNVRVWETYQGKITVRDGDTWWRELTGVFGREPDGLVDSVTWQPCEHSALVLCLVICMYALLVNIACWWLIDMLVGDASAHVSDDDAQGPR